MFVSSIQFLFSHDFLFKEIKSELKLFHCFCYLIVSLNPIAKFIDFTHLSLGSLGIIPKVGCMRDQFFFFYLCSFDINVKETSSAHPGAPTGL
jgi:hypothetical protein